MKKLLIITQGFPPYSGRGHVMRMLKFAKYLPEFGWQPYVMAEQKDTIEDSSLLKQLPSTVEIKYIDALSPRKKKNEYKKLLKKELRMFERLKYFLYRSFGYNLYSIYQNYLMAPDQSLFWAKETLHFAKELHSKQQFDAFLTSGPPFSTFRIGLEIKDALQIPWVLDFRDSWVGNLIYRQLKRSIINWRNRYTEKNAVSKADLIIFATSPMQVKYMERYPEKQQQMVTITNGFDAADFENISLNKDKNEKLNIVYSGTISGKHEPTIFLKSVSKVISQNPWIKKNLKITFIGKFNYKSPELLTDLSSLIEVSGVLPHEKALQKMNDADTFLLLINPVAGRTMMTSKIFEYLALRKPIFAVSNPCAATELIDELKAGYFAEFSNENQIMNQLLNIYNDWKSGNLIKITDSLDLKRFERRQLTNLLHLNLEKLTITTP